MDFEEDPPQNSESDDDLVSLEQVDGLNKGQLKEQLVRALSRLVNADEQIESLQRKAELLKSDLARAESGVNKLQTQVAEKVETLQQETAIKESLDRKLERSERARKANEEDLKSMTVQLTRREHEFADLQMSMDRLSRERDRLKDELRESEDVQRSKESLDSVRQNLFRSPVGDAKAPDRMIRGTQIRARKTGGIDKSDNPYLALVEEKHANYRPESGSSRRVEDESERTARLVKSKLMKDKDAKISGLEVQSQDKMVNSEFLTALFKALQTLNVECLAHQVGHLKEYKTVVGRAEEMYIFEKPDFALLDKHYGQLLQVAVANGKHVDLKLKFHKNAEDINESRTFTHLFRIILETLSKTSLQAEVDNVMTQLKNVSRKKSESDSDYAVRVLAVVREMEHTRVTVEDLFTVQTVRNFSDEAEVQAGDLLKIFQTGDCGFTWLQELCEKLIELGVMRTWRNDVGKPQPTAKAKVADKRAESSDKLDAKCNRCGDRTHKSDECSKIDAM